MRTIITQRDSKKNKYVLWGFFTVGTSLIPIIIRVALLLSTAKVLQIQDFRVELFFLTIIFLVDAIKNFKGGSVPNYFASFLLIFSSTMYCLTMADSLQLLNVTLSEITNTSMILFGVGSFLFDIFSVISLEE